MNTKSLLYSQDLITWVKVDGEEATIGFTNYASARMEELITVELKDAGNEISQFGGCGCVNLIKTAQDIPAPISGVILANNPEAIGNPDLVLQDPYGEGWLLKVRVTNPAELGNLLSASEYEARIALEPEAN